MGTREEAAVLYQEGLCEEALELYLSEATDPSDDPELSYLIGICHTKLENWDTAETYLLHVIEYDINMIRVYQSRMVLSYIYNLTGSNESALFQLTRIREEGFDSPQLRAQLGYSHWIMGNLEDSLTEYNKSLELDPDNANALNSLGYILAEEGVDVEKAIEYCQKALSTDPLNANYIDSLGWALYKKGDYINALDYLKRALKENGTSEDIKRHCEIVEAYAR